MSPKLQVDVPRSRPQTAFLVIGSLSIAVVLGLVALLLIVPDGRISPTRAPTNRLLPADTVLSPTSSRPTGVPHIPHRMGR